MIEHAFTVPDYFSVHKKVEEPGILVELFSKEGPDIVIHLHKLYVIRLITQVRI